MASIAAALERIKQGPLDMLDRRVIERICDELEYDWRERKLDPATTLALFVQQVLLGNTPCSEVRHIAGSDFSASAYCQARARLPLGVCQAMLTEVCDAVFPATRQGPAPVARAPRVPHRRFDLLHARYAGTASGLRDALGVSSPAAVFRWLICWCCSAPPRGCSWTPGPRRCVPETWRRSSRRTCTWTPVTC